MNQTITCILPFPNHIDLSSTVHQFIESPLVDKIILIGTADAKYASETKIVFVDCLTLTATDTWKSVGPYLSSPYTMIYTKGLPLDLGSNALHRYVQVADNCKAGMVYADYYKQKLGQSVPHPVIDYQEGSLRDDFDFGSLLFYKTQYLLEAIDLFSADYLYGALYHLRLAVADRGRIIHLPEFLYTEVEPDLRHSGEKQFDYVDPRNRQKQIEMEQICTEYLKRNGAWLSPHFMAVPLHEDSFEIEASVIIPVRNRAKTIMDAIGSVLNQQTSFHFNLIIVDNHSTDGTTEIIKEIAQKESRLIHLIPDRIDLGIGGCWNMAINHPSCGKFAIQLDSDDLYAHNQVIEQIVAAFYSQECAMVVGSYQMVNFKLESIPPGLIDHREWSPENGRNNALRINGLGAPRAFFVPILRSIQVPNVSYGEDYALGLAISRHYQIGRIYESLYLCRRWDENSDAALDVSRLNIYNSYKDKIRTIELLARKQLVLAQKVN